MTAPESPDPHGRPITRRRLLYLGGASAAGVAGARVLLTKRSPPPRKSVHHDPMVPEAPTVADIAGFARWSDPATWKGKPPGTGDVAKVDVPVVLDVDANVAGVVVGPNGILAFHPDASHTLTSAGNIVVSGRLMMRPAKPSVVHRIQITGSRESAFKGGGVSPLSTDTGLWIMDAGLLDAIGSAKLGWTRAAGSLARGATQIALAAVPEGWQVGDEIAVTPTVSPATPNSYAAYDYATIARIDGRTIVLSKALGHDHPRVTVAKGKSYAAEILNLTRNVSVEGLPAKRIHVFIHTSRPQTIRYMATRYTGPRQAAAGGGTDGILGRYGLHFHHVHDAARGSLVEGCVVRDSGHHAFVPHASHGVTFRDCVAHGIESEAYWWDPGPGNASDATLYDRCVASLVSNDSPRGKFRLAGFWLGHGVGNRILRSVATGVVGEKTSSGFIWPESPGGVPNGSTVAPGPKGDNNGESLWVFEDCVGHNNKANGIFVWQNTRGPTNVDRFVGYHNGKSGVEHGAYRNVYRYRDSILYGNGTADVILHAVAPANGERPLTLEGLTCNGAGLNEYSVLLERHLQSAGRATIVRNCSFSGYKVAALGSARNATRFPDFVDITGCTFSGNEFLLADGVAADTLIRVQDPKHGSIALHRKDQPGQYRPEWNASVTTISKFA